MKLLARLNKAPHLDILAPADGKVDFQGAQIAIWTDHFDCPEETEFWYCIKDDLLDLNSLKAKRRYEIKKGQRNFTTRIIHPDEYAEELYHVYVESLKGYPSNPTPVTREAFQQSIQAWSSPECCLFGVFDNASGQMCGYSDVYLRNPYLPISSLKTIPDFERYGVNIALVYGIYQHFEEAIKNGCYLCDGSRNALHETHFQDYLMKYLGFRRAYCRLHMDYRWYIKPFISILFPIRKSLRGGYKKLYSLLKMEAWSRGIKED